MAAAARFALSLVWLAVATAGAQTAAPSAPPQELKSSGAASTVLAEPAPADAGDAEDAPPADIASQVRIVRLSQVRGKAQIERSPGSGFAPAFANIPVVSGSRLRTEAGVAEVEFEDGSTLRLTPNSAIDFTLLGRTAAGSTVSQIAVMDGSVYVSLARAKGAVFQLTTGKAQMQLTPGTHIRLEVSLPEGAEAKQGTGAAAGLTLAQSIGAALGSDPDAFLTVFDGEVDFSNPSGHAAVPRKRTLSFSTSTAAAPVIETHVEKAPFDTWDKQAVDYQKRYSNAAFGSAGQVYGASDLQYYGGFADLPGCGQVWRPYFASAAWDPYDNGVWAWYGNAGYSWVSPYPWGWLPYHTGAWQFCGAGGWGWRPGGAWYGLANRPRFFHPVVIGVKHPPHPPRPPAPNQPRMVAVNTQSMPVSTATPDGKFNFHRDSAGFGVPREGFHHLGHESALLDRKGVAQSHIDLGRFQLPATNRPLPPNAVAGFAGARGDGRSWPNGAGANTNPANAGAENISANRAAWAAAHAGQTGVQPGAPQHGSGSQPHSPAGGWGGGMHGGGGGSSSTPSPGYRPMPSSGGMSPHGGPPPSAPSSHSAPAPSSAPSAGGGHPH